MFSLIKKDFIAGWMFLIGVVILIPFITMIAMWAMMDDFGGVIIGIFTFIVMVLCIASSFIFLSVDTTYKAEMIYASLPIKRSKIVIARYLSSFILTTGSFSLAVLSCFSMVYIFNHTDPAFKIILSFRGIISMISFLFMILC
ncbi:MAG TPA: ABC-2 transporter permease, partial [bacterium]